MSKQPFSAEEFEYLYSRVPRLTVEVVISTNAGVALVKRSHASWFGLWHLPGGTVLYQEPLVDTVKRIAQSELRTTVTVGSLLGYIEYPSEQQQRGFGYSVGLAFACQAVTQLPVINDDGEEIKFFENLPADLVAEQRPLLEKVLSNAT